MSRRGWIFVSLWMVCAGLIVYGAVQGYGPETVWQRIAG